MGGAGRRAAFTWPCLGRQERPTLSLPQSLQPRAERGERRALGSGSSRGERDSYLIQRREGLFAEATRGDPGSSTPRLRPRGFPKPAVIQSIDWSRRSVVEGAGGRNATSPRFPGSFCPACGGCAGEVNFGTD